LQPKNGVAKRMLFDALRLATAAKKQGTLSAISRGLVFLDYE
jgi:hypothetical protein